MKCFSRGVAALMILAQSGAAIAQMGEMPPMVPIETPAQPGAIALYPKDAALIAAAGKEERWNSIMGEKLVRNVTVPTLTPFLPDLAKATGAAVIVAPGGAFLMVSMEHEGWSVARWLADRGIAAFVLKYRVEPTPVDEREASKVGMARLGAAARDDLNGAPPPSFPAAIEDGAAAVKLVRENAAKWGVDPHRVGMLGFSAGAMTALQVTLADKPETRPDFIGLVYGPMSPATISPAAPPLFAALAADDPLFGRGGFGLIDSWRKAKRPVEFHFYQHGGHGFGLRQNSLWIDEFMAWMKTNKLLDATK